MRAPLSWLKEYVDITLSPKSLGERLTEIGLGTEKIEKTQDDTIFELEITPNRPDLLSIVGIAREIAALEGKKIKLSIKPIPKPSENLIFKIHNDFNLIEHLSCVVIKNVTIKESPDFIKKRLAQLNLRPINNVVDVTNYVMFELGIPLHAFDYDSIFGHEFFIEKSKGGERFTSVDNISYTLPKNAIIIKDREKIVDLVGIKGGLNSGIKKTTKTVLLQTSSNDPILIRRASQSLALRSDASSILEKGIDKNGMLPALYRACNLILSLSEGKIASDIFDLKEKNFGPSKLNLSLERLNKILGFELPKEKVMNVLNSLNLSPVIKKNAITCTIPTYRNDLKIEEDLIEEVARLYGYNNFPKTIPSGEIPTKKIPYSKDYRLDEKVKNIFKSAGFSEIFTYSLISEKDLSLENLNSQSVLRVDNPVSREFEYLRPTLKINLQKALIQNKPNFKSINLFELGKIYLGKNLDDAKETYSIGGITNDKSFFEIKGLLEKLFEDIGIKDDPTKYIYISGGTILFELNYDDLIAKANFDKKFKALPKYPPVFEDLAIVAPANIKTSDIISEIKTQSTLIINVSLLDQFENSRTFHIIYQHKNRNLTNEEVGTIREKILKNLKEEFDAILKI